MSEELSSNQTTSPRTSERNFYRSHLPDFLRHCRTTQNIINQVTDLDYKGRRPFSGWHTCMTIYFGLKTVFKNIDQKIEGEAERILQTLKDDYHLQHVVMQRPGDKLMHYVQPLSEIKRLLKEGYLPIWFTYKIPETRNSEDSGNDIVCSGFL